LFPLDRRGNKGSQKGNNLFCHAGNAWQKLGQNLACLTTVTQASANNFLSVNCYAGLIISDFKGDMIYEA